LKENESRFQAIFDQAAVGFAYIESRTGRLVKVNKKFCEIIGFRKGSGTSDTFMSITHPDDLQEDLDNMEKLLKRDIREFSMEKRYIRKDGSIVWGNLTVSALWNPGQSPDYHIAIVEDITDRKKTAEELKNLNIVLDQRVAERTEELKEKSKKLEKSSSQLLMAFEASNEGLYDLDLSTNAILFSPTWYEMLGYEPYEFPATLENVKKLFHPEDIEMVLKTELEYISQKKSS
jgi:PAS domain S-box-containing protein